MKKKITFLSLYAVLFALCVFAEAQQPKKIPRIGFLVATSPSVTAARIEGFRQGLRELGYTEGQNIGIEYRYADGSRNRLNDFAAELVRIKVDVIVVAGGDTWIRSAKNATKTIPIIMVGQGADPVEAGFVESLARPGGNVTGLTNLNRELGGKRLELLKDAVTKISRIAVIYDPANTISVLQVKENLPVAARGLGLTVRSWEVRVAEDFDRVLPL